MKYFLLYVLTLITADVVAQQHSQISANGIYVSDSDFLLHRLKDGFDNEKGARLNNNRQPYLVVQTKALRDTVYFDEIWGFRKNGEDWRVYHNDYYKIDYRSDKVCLYDIPGTGQGEGTRTTHYFSSSLSSPIHHLSKKELISVYHSNPGFTGKIRSMRLTESIFKWDRKSHTYVFMQWL